jgi:hypothetical protein
LWKRISLSKGLHTIGKGIGIAEKLYGALLEKDFNTIGRT